MKNIILIFVIIFCSTMAFAQDIFSKAGVGLGASTSSFKLLSSDAYNNHSHIFANQAMYNVGVTRGKVEIETGIGYLLTGVSFVKEPGVPFCGEPLVPGQTQPAVTSSSVKYTIRNRHIVIPLAVSYRMDAGKRLSLHPGIGIAASFNTKGSITSNATADLTAQEAPKIYYSYNTVCAIGMLKFDVQYKICEHMHVWAGPGYQHMLTSLTKKVAGDHMSREYDRALLFNVGVRFDMHCPYHNMPARTAK